MATTIKKKAPNITSDGYAYLTKRIVVSKARAAGKDAAKKAMATMGYVITVKGHWIVRQDQDGSVIRLKKVVQHT